jgi:leucyl-tRNA synthetase
MLFASFYLKIPMKYDHLAIEKKWQNFWREKKTFKASEVLSKQKYYVLDMFPYPSGAGLHVGHLIGYTATDIMARYKWAKGLEVLHPMGWDSFGLPAEQYAIRTGTHPAITTEINVKKFKEQLQSVGYAYDWDREIMTSDSKYYKWTQTIFTKLYERGLAYQAEMLVNYCPALGTVLSNEEIEGGRSVEGGHPVERRPLRQWILKITAYADRLLNDLDLVDWPEGLKKLQRNWIGRSTGARIQFKVAGKQQEIEVFTTCPHTLFGTTYLVLSPEHPLVDQVSTMEHYDDVKKYQKKALEKSDLERTELADTKKTGVFTGGYALHPVTSEKIPIWIADYVLMGYGTGAIMGVPAHDERDQAFAEVFHLPIKPVVEEGRIINSKNSSLALNGLSIEEASEKMIVWLEENGRGVKAVSYRLRDWLFSRQRYWGEPFPILHFEDGTMRPLDVDELPLTPPEIQDFKPSATGESPLARDRSWVEVTDPKTGKKAFRETNTMPQWAGSCWYYLRFCDPHNVEEPFSRGNERYWMPVDLYVGGAEHAVLHLLYARFWHKVLYDAGWVSTLEPFQTLLNQGLIVSRSFQKSNGHYVPPEEVVEREGNYFHWETNEELKTQIEKMSKSKLNGVSPDEVREEFGADALRLYSMFMGPIDKEKVWHTEGVSGCKRFLNRFYEMAFSEKVTDQNSEEGLKLGHKLVHGVTEDIEKMFFNTAIAKMMEFTTAFTKLASYPKNVVKMATQVLAPFAPHIAEEVWQHLGEKGSVAHELWPEADPKYLIDEQATYVVQVNGKLRGHFELPKDQNEETILQLAKNDPKIAKHITGDIVKVIFVPNKLLNLVIK